VTVANGTHDPAEFRDRPSPRAGRMRPNGRVYGQRDTRKRSLSTRLGSHDYRVRSEALEESAHRHAEAMAEKGWGPWRPASSGPPAEGVRPTLAVLAEAYPGAFHPDDVAHRLDVDRIVSRATVHRDPLGREE
jgi:hypothetical protein